MTIYILPRLHEYEVIPKLNTWSLYIVHYPGLSLSLYHYIFIILLSSNKPAGQIELLYQASQYGIPVLYSLLVAHNWNVRNKSLYFAQLKTIWPFLFLLAHGFLFSLLDTHTLCVGPLLSFYLGIYWKFHTRLLDNINKDLLESEILDS